MKFLPQVMPTLIHVLDARYSRLAGSLTSLGMTAA